MTIKSKHLLIWVAAVAFTITIGAITGPRQSVAASVEDVAMMKSADRQKILIEGAKKEGKLMWYTTLIVDQVCLLYTSPSPRDRQKSRMPSSA